MSWVSRSFGGVRAAMARGVLALALLVGAPMGFAQTTTAPAASRPDVPVAPAVAWKAKWEHWHVLEIGGAPAGWMREQAFESADRYRSEMEQFFRISRGPVQLEVRMTSSFVETKDGKPLELRFTQDMSQQRVDTRWVFHDDHVESVAQQGGRKVRRELPLPKETWLTPMAAYRYRLARDEAGADVIEFRTVTGESGTTPIAVRMERTGTDEATFAGRTIPVTVWSTTSSAMPGVVSKQLVSAEGQLVREEVMLPFGAMVSRAVTREVAIAAGAAPPPELMLSMFVPVDPPIARVHDAKTATLLLRTREGALPALPTAGAQRIERIEGDDGAARLRIDIDDPVPAPEADGAEPSYRASSALVDAEDPYIGKLAAAACRGVGDDPRARAEAMRAFVYDHVSQKALETAFASASETARTRTGDCSEHGVLLCALLRAQGVPARVATGLVYADAFAGERDIFGWHMWTQALIDGRWIDLDATLDRRYHAGHILTATSSLDDGAGSAELASTMMLLGNLEVEVEEVGY